MRLPCQRVWVDKLAWSPNCNQLAFSIGRCVQVWNADDDVVEVTLNFDSSSILDLAWHPIVKSLAVSGYQGVKVWNGEDWDEDPHVLFSTVCNRCNCLGYVRAIFSLREYGQYPNC